MQLYLLSFPLWILFVVLVLGGALLAAGASWLAGRHLRCQPDENDVGVAIFQMVGAIFSITLAFTISAVYEEFENARNNVSQESNAIVTLLRLSKELPEPQSSTLQAALHTYTQQVVEREWPLMMNGQPSDEVSKALHQLWNLQRDLPENNHTQQVLEQRVYENLQNLTGHRRIRIFDSREQLAPMMWGLLLGGGFITVAFAISLRTGNNRSQALMVGSLAAAICFCLLLVMALDSPFSGSLQVTPDAFDEALKLFQDDL
ncbi:bestrophin-like domain [Pseudomonas turukhanskensis]|uniref:DUF4239 domain-containing protein n=1 Tax=Pseudomonas turukhanskensis TaxID=1806536 RepID=A0A9W6NGN7_9PSED|nr:bestrophin family ion channel [Pseudomonas turukhanskensis]GLK90999.1 hypothetical protein GCM10017655_40630 [Pseudomonas turukhanskensis]